MKDRAADAAEEARRVWAGTPGVRKFTYEITFFKWTSLSTFLRFGPLVLGYFSLFFLSDFLSFFLIFCLFYRGFPIIFSIFLFSSRFLLRSHKIRFLWLFGADLLW